MGGVSSTGYREDVTEPAFLLPPSPVFTRGKQLVQPNPPAASGESPRARSSRRARSLPRRVSSRNRRYRPCVTADAQTQTPVSQSDLVGKTNNDPQSLDALTPLFKSPSSANRQEYFSTEDPLAPNVDKAMASVAPMTSAAPPSSRAVQKFAPYGDQVPWGAYERGPRTLVCPCVALS